MHHCIRLHPENGPERVPKLAVASPGLAVNAVKRIIYRTEGQTHVIL